MFEPASSATESDLNKTEFIKNPQNSEEPGSGSINQTKSGGPPKEMMSLGSQVVLVLRNLIPQ